MPWIRCRMKRLCDNTSVAVFGLVFVALIGAASASVCQGARELDYANALQARGEYYRAVSVYDRHLYLHASSIEDSLNDYAEIARCFYLGGDDAGLMALNGNIPRHIASRASMTYQLSTYIGLRHLAKRAPRISMIWFERSTFDIRSRLLVGMTHLYLFDWDAAKTAFRALEGSRDQTVSRVAGDFLETAATCAEAPMKKPIIAGVLSVVPGAGYAYAGMPGSALSSLVINSLLFGSAYEFFDNDLKAPGATAILVGLGFYLGQMYGSANAVAKQNMSARHECIDRTLERHRQFFESPAFPYGR